jgi:hypothetical protein
VVIGQGIDSTGFAGIGSASKSNFVTSLGRAFADAWGTKAELRLVKDKLSGHKNPSKWCVIRALVYNPARSPGRQSLPRAEL